MERCILGGKGLDYWWPGQFLGGPAQAQVFGVNPFDTVDANPFVAQEAMNKMAENELIAGGFLPGAGGRPDGIGGVLHDITGAVDPVLDPITKVGVGAGKVMDVYNKITGNDGGPMPGTNQTPAQAAQNPSYNPYVPTTKAQPIAVPVNVGAASAGGPTSMAVPTQQVGGVPVASYVPMEVNKTEEAKEEEIEDLKNMLAMQGNFLSGVVNRTA